jgi:hypothetical protein
VIGLHLEAIGGLHPTPHYQVWLKNADLADADAQFSLVAHMAPLKRVEAVVGAMRSDLYREYVPELATLLEVPIDVSPSGTQLKELANELFRWLADPVEHGYSRSTQIGRLNPIAGWVLGETVLFLAPSDQVVAVKVTDPDGTILGLVETNTASPTQLSPPTGAEPIIAETVPDNPGEVLLQLSPETIEHLRKETARTGGIQFYRFNGTWTQPIDLNLALLPTLLARDIVQAVGNPIPLDAFPESSSLTLVDNNLPDGATNLTYWAAAKDILGQTGTLSPRTTISLAP